MIAVYNSQAFKTASGVEVGADAEVTVRQESDGGLATIYEDSEGATPLSNPFNAEADGSFTFYVAADEEGFRIDVDADGEVATLRNVAIGMLQYRDVLPAEDVPYTPVTGTDATEVQAALDDLVARMLDAEAALFARPLKNLIIGGNFDTNPWQRGTSFASPVTATFIADRWKYLKIGAAVHSIGKSALSPTLAQAGFDSASSLYFDVTTIDAAIAAGDFTIIQQAIEGYNFRHAAQRELVLSFWHMHSKTGTYCVSLRNSGLDRSYVAEYTQAVSDTWEKAEIVIPASPTGGTWDYTTGIGLLVGFALSAGTAVQTTPNAWQTGNFIASANQVNATDHVDNTNRFALIQLEVGSEASAFEQRDFEREYQLCRRYYQKSFPIGTAPAQNAGQTGCHFYRTPTTGVQTFGSWVTLQTPMRAVPTITFYNPSAAASTWQNITDASASGASSVSLASEKGFFAQNPQAATDEATDALGIHWQAESEL